MSARRAWAVITALLAAMAGVMTMAPAQAAEPEVVLSTDFEDGTWAPWTQSGGPTLSVVDVDGGKALQVADRDADYEGIESPGGLLQEGETYTLSMRARLAPGTAGTAQIRFVVKPAYSWVGNTTIDADGWTTVTGTYIAAAGATTVYLGTSELSGGAAPYTYLVDDITITGPGTGGGEPWEPTPDPTFVPGGAVNPTETPLAAARGTGDVAALTFDDGPNPGETERLLDILKSHGVKATFCVIGQNIQAPGGADILKRIVAEGHTLCNHSTSYADMGGWTHAAVEADLKQNLAIIRQALGKPNQKVPYWRAPNGSWGVTGEVAAALGMQPLGLGNLIFDWDGNDLSEETLTANLRNAFQPGAVVLVHDGGGNRDNSISAVETVLAEKVAEGWAFTLPAGGIPGGEVVLSTGFEDGLDGWGPRADGDGPPTVAVTAAEKHNGAQAALVSARTTQGDGIAHTMTGLMTPGVTYEISAWVKMAAGVAADDIWLSMQRESGGATSYDTVGQFANVGSGEWQQVTATYQVPASDALVLYFETSYNTGSNGDFLVDDIVVRSRPAIEIEDLTPLKETTDIPVGVAIDERETTGAAADLTTTHFDQITPENHMKPEAWYGEDGAFRLHPQAEALMTFAQQEGLRVYGHTLVWHSQTPAWFFEREDGTLLTSSEADKQVLRDRMKEHIDNVAATLAAEYGPFGSATNPLVAWDVVNEVVSDSGEFADGLRRSRWYDVLGEEYIRLAFQYADQAFNGEYAAAGSGRPVTLFINDYNTEQGGKRARMHALVERLLAAGAPVDGVGHQFHVSLSMPVQALEDAIVDFGDLPVIQVVTELDVTTGTPETEANLIEQGYYYRDAFRIFREHAEDLFSVTVWGLNDARSWRDSSGAPLLFDDALQAKPAFFGAIDGELPGRQRTAFVFRGGVPLGPDAAASPEWERLPLHAVEDVARFQLRWQPDHLTAYVRVTEGAGDAVTFAVGEQTYTVNRNGTGDVDAVAKEVEGGYAIVAHLPLTGATEADLVDFDVRVGQAGWSSAGQPGTLTLVEPLSFTETVATETAPTIDGTVDSSWAVANVFETGKQVSGPGSGEATASAKVRTMWRGQTLYLLAEVADDTLDATGSDPWIQDSVEIFLDAGNVKNGPYRYDDTQIRISYANVVSFGTGDEAFQANRVESETRTVAGGYVVEAAISLLEYGGLGTFHGLDVQVNDAEGGARVGMRNWADPTSLGYQSTARWGVTELVAAPEQPEPGTATVTVTGVTVAYGRDATVTVEVAGPEGVTPTGTVSILRDGTALGTAPVQAGAATIRVPKRSLLPASYTLTAAYSGDDRLAPASTPFTFQVARAASRVEAKLRPATVKADRGRARMRIAVTGEDGVAATGAVTVKVASRTVQVTLVDGQAVVRLPRFAKPGRKVVTVAYAGDSRVAPSSTRVTLRVVR